MEQTGLAQRWGARGCSFCSTRAEPQVLDDRIEADRNSTWESVSLTLRPWSPREIEGYPQRTLETDNW